MDPNQYQNTNPQSNEIKKILQWLLHLGLFLLTFFSTAIAGVNWLLRPDIFDLKEFYLGIPYAIAILFILTCHEFGHYFAARYHKVETTLPYYIPFPPISYLYQLFGITFGTFGAVIRIKGNVPSRKVLFDIGAAGPIAGFVASLLVLIFGFTHLPSKEYILAIHPDYNFAINASTGGHGNYLAFGNTLLFSALRELLTNPSIQFVPPMTEIYHYPYLCAGWFGLFVTALNLIPIGQFDGGHLIYAMFGNLHKKIARYAFYILMAFSLPSLVDSLLRMLLGTILKHEVGQIIPFAQYSNPSWFFWSLIAYYIIKLFHPPVADETRLDSKRVIIGWFCILIFILTISLNPLTMGS